MENTIPENLNELRKANSKPNPVNIAGYGQESTHKGYLSWILDSDRNPKAIELATILVQRAAGNWRHPFLGSKHNPISIQRTWVTTEEKVGKHFIDLMLHIEVKGKEYSEYIVGIEIKTDSGPSSRHQFENMFDILYDNTPSCLGAIALLLGTSSVMPHHIFFNGFESLTFEDLYKLWYEEAFGSEQISLWHKGKQRESNPLRFLHDYMRALAMETARKNLAHNFYLTRWYDKDTDTDFRDFGYRSYRHPIMFLYPEIAKRLNGKIDNGYWIAEHSQHNSTLTCYYTDNRFTKPTNLDGLEWYWEFVDDTLHVKVVNNNANLSDVKKWLLDTKMAVTILPNLPVLTFRKTPLRLGTWMTICKWEVDLTDIKEACKEILILTEIFEEYIINGNVINPGEKNA